MIPTVTIDQVPDPLPEGLVVLDVREPVEWQYAHIEGAIHMPMATITERHTELPDARTLVVCKVGGRSAQAVQWLQQQGHEVVNLAGGMIEWAEAGRPMVSETGHPPQVV